MSDTSVFYGTNHLDLNQFVLFEFQKIMTNIYLDPLTKKYEISKNLNHTLYRKKNHWIYIAV